MGNLFDWDTWKGVANQTADTVEKYLPNLIAALGVLVAGWIVALILAAITRWAMRRTGLGKRISAWFSKEGGATPPDVGRRAGQFMFYLVMLFVLVAFFQVLGLTIASEPLMGFLNQVFEYAPRLVAAAVLLMVAWLVATGSRFLVFKGLSAIHLDRRLSRQLGDEEEAVPLAKTVSDTVYWLVFLLFLPLLLDTLAVPGLLAPVQELVGGILGFLPNLFAAAIILVAGWFLARIVQRIVSNLLASIGTDRLSERVGIAPLLGRRPLSAVLGLVVYVLVLIPVIVGALNALQIQAVTQPASEMLNAILAALPGIFAALLVIAVAYIAGRVVAALATNLLSNVGFDQLPARLGLRARRPETGGGDGPGTPARFSWTAPEPASRRTPSRVAGTIIFVAIMFFAVMQALPLMGFDLLAGMISQFLVFGGHVLVGLVIIALGLYLGRLAGEAIYSSGIRQAGLLSATARVAIVVVAAAMALQQMGLADEIVNLAFGITLGAVAVAAAIAFGIGGRDAAKTLIDNFMESRRAVQQPAGNSPPQEERPAELTHT